MKLVHSEYDVNLELKENQIQVVIIENSKMLAEIVQELYRQYNGGEGEFVLSENNKILPLNKHMELITDVFALDCNEKKIIAKLYQEMEEQAAENLILESKELNSAILCYLEKICGMMPYHLEYQTEFFPSKIMKMADLKFEAEAENLLERIVEYLGITGKIFRCTVYIFVNLKLFLTKEEIEKLYEFAFYNKIPLILIEGVMGEIYSGEKITIIDMDKCMIKL